MLLISKTAESTIISNSPIISFEPFQIVIIVSRVGLQLILSQNTVRRNAITISLNNF